MTSDLLNLSVTGLRTSKAALSTVGHNIANAGTEGYSRQRIQPVTNPTTLGANGYVGNGVNAGSIERIVNNFVTDQLRTDTTLHSDLDSYYAKITQLDNLLSDPSTGLTSALQSFYASMENGSDDPTSIAARELIISEASTLADRFNAIHNRLDSITQGIEADMAVAVSSINAIAENIANLNRKIADSATSKGDPNDLLDQRDIALGELAKLVPLQSFDQGSGLVNVVIGNGQALVVGYEARALRLADGVDDTAQQEVFFANGDRTGEAISSLISGGELGGLIRIRDDVVDKAFNSLGRIAVVTSENFNRQHQQGLDLEGAFGGDFFTDLNQIDLARQRVIASSNNLNPDEQVLSLFIEDTQAITTSDYRLNIGAGGAMSIVRAEDQTEVFRGILNGQYPQTAEFDGLSLTVEQGEFQAGDSFVLRPTRAAGRDFSSVISSAANIAFASPLLTDSSLSNLGSGSISDGSVLSLYDQAGDPLPLFAQAGEMNPPLIVRFNTPTSYDILDNSDPGNPVHLDPPIRDQRYVPGIENRLFSEDAGQTLVSTVGALVGLPDGRSPVTQTALFPGGQGTIATVPGFAVTDFSATNAQFSFDVVADNTPGGINNGSFTVTVNSASLVDDDALLLHVNAQLASSDISAFIADNGSLAFRLNTAGYGNLSIQNYDADPDGNGDNAAAGLANTLLGWDVEGSTFTTIGDADGIAGQGALNNGYPAEFVAIQNADGSAGTRILTELHESARSLASRLSNIAGVEANASSYAEISELQLTAASPLQVTLNGQDLLEYGFDSATGTIQLSESVPDPNTDQPQFYDYLSEQINNNPALQALGIYAQASNDVLTGRSELQIFSSEGDDLNIGFTGATGDQVSVSDGLNSDVVLSGAGTGLSSQISIGGQLDVTLADGLTLTPALEDSMLFGAAEAQSTYLGIQASISGRPEAGDTFTLDFNLDAARDNRNALNLVELESQKLIGGVASIDEGYGVLVEDIGISTNSAKISLDAADQVLEQTKALRDSISGVNLDEEASDLIRYEQLFSANAQVISVARDIFDRLLSSF